ncbi:MAG TPA: protein-L-isoaspartate(D-aspartate) O-methyltransferase [Dehalococcoidia bacterium]|nr:protein-L-isoaspartate(D-aspartate) O-methyltransferase [Dehalococcoidia bacterium]
MTLDPFAEARAALVRSLRDEITDERVLAAIGKVPRERFVTDDLAAFAYQDRPLPIGHGQTISQPRMVALMLQELALKGGERVLEVGSGSGYQTALLSKVAGYVVGVELLPDLVEKASQALALLDYQNVELHAAGEALGWRAGAPYDAIVVAAAAPRIPQSLVDQLAPGGRLVIPVGSRAGQELMLVELRPEGLTVTRKGACRFVPLLGAEAFAASVSDSHTS